MGVKPKNTREDAKYLLEEIMKRRNYASGTLHDIEMFLDKLLADKNKKIESLKYRIRHIEKTSANRLEMLKLAEHQAPLPSAAARIPKQSIYNHD